MVKSNKNSVDGFIARRPAAQPNREHGHDVGPTPTTLRELNTAAKPVEQEPRRGLGVSRSEISESLKDIDVPSSQHKKHRRNPEQKARRRKLIKWVIILFFLVILGGVGYVGVKALLAGSHFFKGNIFDIIQTVPLKMDADGRTNVLLLGTSEDDPGHQASYLTDSMMIVSIDQNKKNAFMISIPRDLYVKYGRACDAGYQGRINVYYSCVHDNKTGVEADREALTKTGEFLGGITGLDVQYGVNVNYTVMRELVKAVGGSITVTIEGNGPVPAGVKPGSVMDSNFDWKCGVGDRKVTRKEVLRRCPPSGHFIDYGPGPVELDAEHALYLAQARGDASPTYGFAQSNFDREKNQQKIIKALREKVVSAGTLTDFGKVTAVIDALGNNLRTTFEAKEFRTLMSLAQDVKSEDIQSISLIDGDNPVMGTGNIDGQSVVRPNAGSYDYSDLKAYIRRSISSDPVAREQATVVVLNGSGVAGRAQTESDKLEAQGFVMGSIGNAPVGGDYGAYSVYQIGDGNPGTAAKLAKIYGVVIKKTAPPAPVPAAAKFVVVIGKQPAAEKPPQ